MNLKLKKNAKNLINHNRSLSHNCIYLLFFWFVSGFMLKLWLLPYWELRSRCCEERKKKKYEISLFGMRYQYSVYHMAFNSLIVVNDNKK